MPYTAQTFTAFEVPTTAKWNLLWANDAAFNDGSGIANAAILAKHVGFGILEGHLINGKFTVTISSNDLVVAIKGLDGNDPSATNPVKIVIDGTLRTITSALSLTLADGTNWMDLGSAALGTLEHDLFVYLSWRAASSAVVLGISRICHAHTYGDFNSTNTEGKHGAFSTAPASTDKVAVIGRFGAILSLSGTSHLWTLPATQVLVQRPVYQSREFPYVSVPTGYSAITTQNGWYQILGSRCIGDYDIAGTSNSTSFTSKAPIKSNSTTNRYSRNCNIRNNGTDQAAPGFLQVSGGTDTLTHIRDWATAPSGWTNANGKNTAGHFDYPL